MGSLFHPVTLTISPPPPPPPPLLSPLKHRPSSIPRFTKTPTPRLLSLSIPKPHRPNLSPSSDAGPTEEEEPLVEPLKVPDSWLAPSKALQESEWLRVTLHKWLDDEYCPEPANVEISKVAARSYYESLITKKTDLGEILLNMVAAYNDPDNGANPENYCCTMFPEVQSSIPISFEVSRGIVATPVEGWFSSQNCNAGSPFRGLALGRQRFLYSLSCSGRAACDFGLVFR